MNGIKVSQLPEAVSVGDNDLVMIVQDGESKKISISNMQTPTQWGNIEGTLSNQTDLNTALSGKQETLVSGTNIKTINNTSILGNGNIQIDGNEVYISDDDTNIPESAKIFIDESEGTDAYSEVVNSLAGNEIAKAPSVRAVNEALETETIRSNAGLVLKKCGNVVNFYTTKYIEQGTLEGYTIPSEYAPKNVIQVPCMAYYSNTLWTPRHIGNVGSNTQKFQIENPDGHADTSYVYAAFNLVWFI